MGRNYDVITFISNTFISRRARVAIFADIIPHLLKQSLKIQRTLKEIEIMYQNAIYFCIS